MNLERHRKYIALEGKPISDMTNRELRIIENETPSFSELEQAQQELKRRGVIKQTIIESFNTMTGGNIIIGE